MRAAALALVTVTVATLAACGGGDDGPGLAPDVLQDPTKCMECHPKHYDQWSGSMHAYASIDPVFVAMNKRGQRETNNALGTFCLQCHAPMAVALGLTDRLGLRPDDAARRRERHHLLLLPRRREGHGRSQ